MLLPEEIPSEEKCFLGGSPIGPQKTFKLPQLIWEKSGGVKSSPIPPSWKNKHCWSIREVDVQNTKLLLEPGTVLRVHLLKAETVDPTVVDIFFSKFKKSLEHFWKKIVRPYIRVIWAPKKTLVATRNSENNFKPLKIAIQNLKKSKIHDFSESFSSEFYQKIMFLRFGDRRSAQIDLKPSPIDQKSNSTYS